jgi:hypothetical protein
MLLKIKYNNFEGKALIDNKEFYFLTISAISYLSLEKKDSYDLGTTLDISFKKNKNGS